VSVLAVVPALARTMWAPDYPWGVSEERWRDVGRWFEKRFFGTRSEAADVARGWRGPQLTDEEVSEDIDYLRRAAGSPRTMQGIVELLHGTDIRRVLPAIRQPTLLIHGTRAALVPLESARWVASQIPAARLVELEGEHDIPTLDGFVRALDETEAFLKEAWESGAWEEPEPDRVLATILFADIVESSQRAVELGDRAWRELLGRHHELVRRQLVRFRGREVDAAGDGFLASFDGPARAIHCAEAIVEGVHALGLEVRAGLHTGECELLDGKVAGIAVHTGARVASHAAPGEVLVSSTVKDLVAGSGLAFQDRGTHELKGLTGEWRLYAVEP
jgi:class 3 adenylate cyclase